MVGLMITGVLSAVPSITTAEGEELPCMDKISDILSNTSSGTDTTITLSRSFAIRKIKASGNFRLKISGNWFISPDDRVSGSQWTTFIGELDGLVLLADRLTLTPAAWSSDQSPPAFLQLFGCPATSTATATLAFNGTMKSVISRFVTVKNFGIFLSDIITDSLAVDKAAATLQSLTEKPNGKIVATMVLFSTKIPASVFKSKLAEQFAMPESLARMRVSELQEWIADHSEQQCYDKFCPEGSICINGNCVDHSGRVEFVAQKMSAEASIKVPEVSIVELPSATVPKSSDFRVFFVLGVVGAAALWAVALWVTLQTPKGSYYAN